MHVKNRIDVLKLCLRMRSGRNFVGMDSKVNLISNVIQLNIHPKETGINILSIWIVHSTIPNRSPLSISRAYHRDLIHVQNMTETSLSLIWGVTSDSGRGLDFISKQYIPDTLETLFILLHYRRLRVLAALLQRCIAALCVFAFRTFEVRVWGDS